MMIESTPSRPYSHNKINKVLEKDLKEIVLALDPNQLISLFRNLEIEAQITSIKQFTKIGLKCSQCHTKFDTFQSKGYGRDEHEALINSLKIILESMISSGYKIQTIRKTLKYSSKLRQPLITPNQQSNLQSSTKKSMKKVQGIDFNVRSSKKNLQFDCYQDQDKQNMSIRMNEQSTVNANFINLKVPKTQENILKLDNFEKMKEKRNSMAAIIMNTQQTLQTQTDQKCFHVQNPKKCIFYEIQLNSQEEIRNLNARIKLLQEQNSILKELLLKDFKRNPQNCSKTTQQTQS